MSDPRGRFLEARETALALAVRVVDTHTGTAPPVGLSVAIEDDARTPLRTGPGTYVFLGAAIEGDPTVVVDGAARYRPFSESLTIPATGPPAVEVALEPSTAYPFPRGATLVRGSARTTTGTPIAGATITVRDTDLGTTSEASGEFVLPLDSLPVVTRRVTLDPGDGTPARTVPRQVVEVDGTDPTLVVDHDGDEWTRQATVRAGTDWTVLVEFPPS